MNDSVIVVLGFTTLSTSLVISVPFYNEREKSDKFFSEVLISAWGSFTYRKYTTPDPRLYFPPKGSHTQDFYALKKNPSTPAGFEPANLGSCDEYDNQGTHLLQDIYSFLKWFVISSLSLDACYKLSNKSDIKWLCTWHFAEGSTSILTPTFVCSLTRLK